MMRTVGIEEEFLLVGATSPHLAPAGDAVAEATVQGSDGQFEHELRREQAELGTSPHESLNELAKELRQRRAELARGASQRGVRLVALATNPLDDPTSTTPDARYEQMTAQFGRIASMQLTCGMHVHVSVGSDAEGVAVLDRLRPWLALLLALSANSPFVGGEDTGYASYRSIMWGQWPTAGPTEAFGDIAGYERVRASLLASGAAMDEGMIYFDARLSARYPTVEIRVADVCPYASDAVTIAGLTRGLVSTAAVDWSQGRAALSARTELLRAASWRAARWGVEGELVDVVAARLVPAWDLIGRMVESITPALADTGDVELVGAGLAQIRERGTGARLQRESLAATGEAGGIVDATAIHTVA